MLIVAGVNDGSRTLTMLYHCTGEPSRTIILTMAGFDSHLTFMEPETTSDTDHGEDRLSRPDCVTIVGTCFVFGFVVTVMARGIGNLLF